MFNALQYNNYNTPKWIGAYLELSVACCTQSNPKGIIGFGFSKNSFDVSISAQTGKTSTAIGIGATWTEAYVQASLIYSSKKGRYYFAVNFKFAIKHWLSLAVAVICYLVPVLAPIAGSVVKVLCASVSSAKAILLSMLPILLKV